MGAKFLYNFLWRVWESVRVSLNSLLPHLIICFCIKKNICIPLFNNTQNKTEREYRLYVCYIFRLVWKTQSPCHEILLRGFYLITQLNWITIFFMYIDSDTDGVLAFLFRVFLVKYISLEESVIERVWLREDG